MGQQRGRLSISHSQWLRLCHVLLGHPQQCHRSNRSCHLHRWRQLDKVSFAYPSTGGQWDLGFIVGRLPICDLEWHGVSDVLFRVQFYIHGVGWSCIFQGHDTLAEIRRQPHPETRAGAVRQLFYLVTCRDVRPATVQDVVRGALFWELHALHRIRHLSGWRTLDEVHRQPRDDEDDN